MSIDRTDPTQAGISGLRGLNTNEGKERQFQETGLSSSPAEFKMRQKQNFESPYQEVYREGVGESVYDTGITSLTQLDNLANTRGELQPWYAQIGAGLAKGAVLAGTTFADGVIGTIVGLGNAAATGTFSGFWDNPFSNTMQQVNEWSESVLPNYYTDAEKNDPWYENIFSANFIGDKFLKNLGFAVGAAYSGKISAGATAKLLGLNKARQAFKGAVTASGEALTPNAALQAYREGDLFLDGVRLTEELARDAKKLKMAEPTLKITGAFTGALGEARIEAIQNSKDWFELHKQQLDDTQAKVAAQEQEAMLREFPQYSSMQIDPDGNVVETLTPEGQAMLQARVDAKFDYNGGLQKLSEDRAKMGNIDFALNIPLLTVSDAWQFGKFYAGGYNTAKKGSQILRTVAEDGTISYSAAKPSVLRNALKIASKGVAEGPYEEMGQAVAGKVAGYKYASELNDFYGAKIDPDAESETIDWLQATAKAMQQTYGTAEGWEEGFIGGLTGLVGIPGFRSTRNSEGGFQSPVYLQGGVKEDIKEIRERSEKDDAIVAQLNNRVQSPEFLNYYQSAIRHNAYQKQMDEAADNNDNFEFKNAEHNQLISDVVMFDKAGRINDLYDIIEEAGNIREEDVEQIRQLTTNQETGTSVYDNMTDAEVIEQIQKQTKETKKAVDNYRKISQDLQVKIGDYFDEDGLEEMTYYFSNIDNLENRFKSVHEDIKDRLQEVLDASMDREFISDSDENKITRLSDLLNFSPVRLINALADSKESQSYISLLDKALQTDPNKQDIIDEVKDLQKIAERRLDFIDKYDTYLRNPQALAQKQERQRENIIKENERQEIAKTKDAALAATNLNEFREALNNEADSSKRQQILDELENEGNKMAKDYKEVQMYNSEVSRAIDSQPISPEAKANAKELLRTQHENANNLEEMANPNSVFINNPESLYDENLPDDLNMMNFAEAQYGLLSAMSKVNNDQRFKARFPVEYLKPVEKTEGTRGTTAKDTTGDSGTSTVPPVNAGPVDTYEPPVGNITSQMVAEENKKANENAPTPQSLDKDSKGKRQYYRPTIPELHINASKDGDFRPFNVVVAEKENLNFDELYNYLRDNRAFSYVNEGNLKVGDELGFMIDPEFNDHTIFIVDRRNNQIVGSLDESQYSIDRYEGLSELIERIKEEYALRNQYVITEKDGVKTTKVVSFRKTKDGEIKQTTLGSLPISLDIIKEEYLLPEKTKSASLMSLREGNGIIAGTIRVRLEDGDSVNMEVQFKSNPLKGINNKFIATPTSNVSGLQRPYYFKAMHEQLKDKESSWEYYRDDINRVYNGIEYVTGASYQSALHPAITLAVDSGVLPRKYKKYLNRTKDDAIEKEDLEEIIAELKKLGINTPKKLLEYVTQNSEDKIDGFIATPTSKDISNYQELKNGDIVHITGFNDRLPDGSIKTERTFKVQGIGERSANLTAIDAESDIGLTNNYINNLKEQGRRVYVSSSSTRGSAQVAQKGDLIHITNTSQGYSDLGEIQEWSKKTEDVRTEPDGFGVKNGLTYFKESYKGGRGGDNITIWFRNEPSQKIKDSIEQLLSSSKDLNEFGDKITELIRDTQSKSKFIATPTTRVSQIMVGRIPYGTEERNMGEIPNVSASSIFGIVKNGVLSTNGRISDDLVTKPMDMSQKEGRMYILIPNAAGKYSPAAVRVKHFNESEYNPEDVTINSTPLYKSIKKSIDALANAFTEEDVNNAVKDLARSLYIGDVHIDYIQGKNGNGIRFTKVQRDANKNEIYDEIEGKRVRREDVKTVYLTKKEDTEPVFASIGEDNEIREVENQAKDVSINPEVISTSIINILQSFNLPLQVNLGMLNKGGYNNMLLSSGVMTSNIVDASVKSNWFTTDYFDIQGNLQQALNPASVKAEEGRKIQTPVGGTEGAIAGTTVSFDNTTYYVDLTSNTVRDNNGRTLNSFPESILDMAYIQENYGDAQNGSMMVGGITLLPNGKVLNRNTGQYVTGAESDKFKQKLAGRKKTIADSKKVIDQIAENQAKVDKTRTDGEFYYILEDDGKYHEYKRVHSVLGSNWVESPAQTKALQDLRVNLSKNVDNITQFNNYLKNLSNHYGVNLTAFEGKIDARSRDTIVNIVRDKMSGTNSQRALEAGTSVDSVIRNFFTSSEMPVKPSNMSEQAFNDLVTSLTEIKSNIEARGETFLTNNIVLFNKYENGNRVAGEVDILSVDANGNFKIYDVKTSRYSFYDFTDRNGRKVNYFKNKSNTQTMSQEQYYTKQLSAYKNLFESQYHTPITTLAILPFVLEYNKDNVSRVSKEKGILLNYDSSVNVPLVGSVSTPEVNNTNSSLPIFNSTFETREPINNVLPDYSMSDSKVGYFLRDGKLHTGYLSPIGKVNGVEVYMTKVPNITKGFGNQPAHVASNDFYAVFPNGNTIALVKNAVLSYSETEAKNNIKKVLEGNPQRVVDMSQESTILYTPSAEPVKIERPIIPATVNQSKESGAKATIAKEAALRGNSKYRKPLQLRQVDDLSRPVWDKEKELAWLGKVLPQLSEKDRVIVTKGLIKVAKTGALAWGQFSGGIITLSDIAAEGTTYHEAFHAVFHLMLDINERKLLYDEARKLYGDKDNTSLEEDMAEGFREYVMSREKRGLGERIIDFFRNLLVKITNWKYLEPHLISYYRAINEGRYSHFNYMSDNRGAVKYIYNLNPKLNIIGTQEDYMKYIRAIYPNSIIDDIYWHGSDSDFSKGFSSAKRGKGSGASETGNELYLNRQPWASIQYVSGINRTIPDNEGFNNWVKLWWEMKAILGNGRMQNDDWKNEIIGPNIRKEIPNKRGIFNLDQGGGNGSYLKDKKAHYGYENKSDKEFFEEVFDIRFGKETFNDWVRRKESEFRAIWESGSVRNVYPVVINVTNPIEESGQNTYYEEERGLMSRARRNGNDAIISDDAKNEFGSDVLIMFNPKSNVHFLGTEKDIEGFRNFINKKNKFFNTLDSNIRESLTRKGWTAEKFDSISQDERDQAIRCS